MRVKKNIANIPTKLRNQILKTYLLRDALTTYLTILNRLLDAIEHNNANNLELTSREYKFFNDRTIISFFIKHCLAIRHDRHPILRLVNPDIIAPMNTYIMNAAKPEDRARHLLLHNAFLKFVWHVGHQVYCYNNKPTTKTPLPQHPATLFGNIRDINVSAKADNSRRNRLKRY